MPETPTFGRYAEIPYDQMSPEQQDAYRSLIETRGRLPGPNKIRRRHHQQQMAFDLPDQRARARRQGRRIAGR